MSNIILKLVVLSISKKVLAYSIGRMYGFPKLYRRIGELNRKLIKTPRTRARVMHCVRFMFRLPRIAYEQVRAKYTDTVGTLNKTVHPYPTNAPSSSTHSSTGSSIGTSSVVGGKESSGAKREFSTMVGSLDHLFRRPCSPSSQIIAPLDGKCRVSDRTLQQIHEIAQHTQSQPQSIRITTRKFE
ncbi:putative mitochondrial protein [Andalucia godoyi]|uniref:Putative mitochondrial protein n=1 Tax=Andalucia godoyi TaxID=505711 RepID=A0A8K0AH42_ANDGO|nr:putative mitochondrial protein [Andalucia godoyi]|eukprot:ANDGO_08785.mRNA.1 putative mitochondrial protein